MPYCEQVKQRLTTWLLAVLLAATAGLAAPSVRALSSRAESCVICVRGARQVRAEIAEPQPPPSIPRQAAPVASKNEAVRATIPLDRALFQRPPPLFPLS
ncbi:MAG TPA: hypothetical protein VKG79_13515 [Bryobacteraceae bacterium]|nr:hypothetical protein [Bryobacteraceae bacterium]